jgi:predicted SprT family Zn-dependent metalloprotease
MAISLLSSYTDDEFKQIVKISSSYSDLLKKLGYNAKSGDLVKMVSKRVQELNCDTSHFNLKKSIVRTEENIFIENSTAEQSTLRKWYKKGNYTEYKCAICGQEPFWNGKELTLILDHINGKNKDDRLENLRWVCPNCN